MKVIVFIGSLETGGTQVQLCHLARGLHDRGHDLRLVTIFPGGQSWTRMHSADGIRPESLFESRPEKRWEILRDLLKAPFRLRSICQGYEVIYSVLELSNVAAWFATRGRSRDRFVWGDRCADVPDDWKRRLPFIFGRLISASIPMIISNSEAGRRLLLDTGYRPRSIKIIRNGIDTLEFYPDDSTREEIRVRCGISEDAPTVGLIGRIAPQKGYEIYLQAAARVAEQLPDARFVCVGDGDRQYVESLKQLSGRLGIDDKMVWTGVIDDMRDLYNALDVCCSASHFEGFPNALAEAMACGIPCVATDVGDSRFILGEWGIVVPPGDPGALANAITRQFGAVGEEGSDLRSRSIASRFSIQRMLDETEQALALLVEEADRPRR